jgi:hypothetical protein
MFIVQTTAFAFFRGFRRDVLCRLFPVFPRLRSDDFYRISRSITLKI